MEDHLKEAIRLGNKDALNNFFYIQVIHNRWMIMGEGG